MQTLTRPVTPIVIPDASSKRKLERRLTVVVTVLPFLGVIAAVWLVWGRGISWSDVVIFAFTYIVSGMGVTVGFHRLLTHRSFDAPKAVKVALAIAGSYSVQGGVIKWVADHRRHHAFTDKPGDPHSPHLTEAEGISGVLRGLWHAHMGWFFDKEHTNVQRFAPDLLRDPAMRWVDRQAPAFIVASFAFPPLMGYILTGTLWGAFTAFIWGSLVRIFLLHHVTWSINSICHFYGSKEFDARDESTNNWIMALLSFGEGWHNNHHAFPSSAVHGLRSWQFDPSAVFIKVLEKVGLAYDVHVPTRQQMEAKKFEAGAALEP
ncbi:MAG: acyl-CoA desaturase [Actinomycetota bacterium]|nr:fatty acid desaturase [Actinomycetota bacterium]